MDDVIELPLPPPPSVNKLRRYNFANARHHKKWIQAAHNTVMAARVMRGFPHIEGMFIAEITFDEKVTTIDDLDNGIKVVLDYARLLKLIKDDSRRYMRELHVKWGDVPQGCLLVLRPITGERK